MFIFYRRHRFNLCPGHCPQATDHLIHEQLCCRITQWRIPCDKVNVVGRFGILWQERPELALIGGLLGRHRREKTDAHPQRDQPDRFIDIFGPPIDDRSDFSVDEPLLHPEYGNRKNEENDTDDDDDDHCCLKFDDLEVHIQATKENSQVMLSSTLLKTSEPTPAVMRRLLAANYGMLGTKGCTVGIHPETGEVLLARRFKLSLHAAFTTLAAFLPVWLPAIAALLVLALAVAWSRLVLERHRPVEVVAGVLAGIAAGGVLQIA